MTTFGADPGSAADAARVGIHRSLDPDDALVPGWDAYMAARNRYLDGRRAVPKSPSQRGPIHGRGTGDLRLAVSSD
ncbi:MAG: hypothetical protein H6531_10480 [Actinobacteria bacterium]|nr:hypothetical protein [Thermoleophilia bacterium]MCB9012242.1 hypothetical protein [Actinomycetota bacterium]